ncbi:uncharacterized protein LOC114274735 [Camellia sinensis]|uniref:uncharacterized protein LOC114274735 n=1 Tax=Camellia sinensis TaxID=4442 RepID=UPI00103596E6|nr:uncharacterized protein LOC114274735 [Camellia sinensis]
MEAQDSIPDDMQPTNREDKVCWLPYRDGKFSIHSAWDNWRSHRPKVPWCQSIWFKFHIPRVRTIVWMAIQERLSTLNRLVMFGIKDSSLCVLCSAQVEDHNHLFFACPFSCQIWNALQSKLNVSWPSMDWMELVERMNVNISGNSSATTIMKLVFTCAIYNVWQERNLRIFQSTKSPETVIIKKVESMVRCRILSVNNFKEDNTNGWFIRVWKLPPSVPKKAPINN